MANFSNEKALKGRNTAERFKLVRIQIGPEFRILDGANIAGYFALAELLFPVFFLRWASPVANVCRPFRVNHRAMILFTDSKLMLPHALGYYHY